MCVGYVERTRSKNVFRLRKFAKNSCYLHHISFLSVRKTPLPPGGISETLYYVVLLQSV